MVPAGLQARVRLRGHLPGLGVHLVCAGGGRHRQPAPVRGAGAGGALQGHHPGQGHGLHGRDQVLQRDGGEAPGRRGARPGQGVGGADAADAQGR